MILEMRKFASTAVTVVAKGGMTVWATLLLILAAVASPSPAHADLLWGSTFGSSSEVFLVDTTDGSIPVYKDFGPLWFGDIASEPTNTYLYVTHWSAAFNQLSQIDVATLTIQQTWTLPTTMNALVWKTGTTDTLYGIQGGGALWGDLYEIKITGATMTTVLVGTIPSIASDGDMARDPTTGKWYATFLPSSTTFLWEVDVSIPANSTQGPALGHYSLNTGRVFISGLAFDSQGTLWGGSWGTNSGGTYSSLDIYTIDSTNGPAGLAPIWDLSGTLEGAGITGLSPAPCALNARNHGAYVSCIVEIANDLFEAGEITDEEREAMVEAAAQSDIGKKK